MTEQKKLLFFSREMIEQVVKAINEDKEFQKIGKGMNHKHVFLISDFPNGTDVIVMYNFRDGKIVNWDWLAKPHPFTALDDIEFAKGADFTVKSSYDFYAKVTRKEVSAMAAMMSPKMKIKGSRMTLARLMKPMTRMADIIAAMPIEFEYPK